MTMRNLILILAVTCAMPLCAQRQKKERAARNGKNQSSGQTNGAASSTPLVTDSKGPLVHTESQDVRYRKVCIIPRNDEDEPDIIEIDEATETETAVIGSAVRPALATDDPNDLLEMNFVDADLQSFLEWISNIFKINFLTDDAINPPPPNPKVITGNKISFKSQKPLTKRQVWDLFLTFMDLFGLSVVKASDVLYKVVSTDPKAARSAARSPLTSFINVHWTCLPNSEERIRYIYFIRNSTLQVLQGIVDSFKSASSVLNILPDLNAFVLTDKAINVRSVMQIVEELDSTSSPEALSVLKLKYADAEEVKAFYDNLTKTEDPRGLAARILGAKKAPSSVYFPDNIRVFAERRSNTLVILGTKDGIRKVEDFIINYVDTEIKVPYSPLYIYELQYTKAEDVANILTAVTKFGAGSPAAESGGVRDGDKYLRAMTFQPEPSGNRLLINGEKEDYLKVVDIIKQLDVKQPQVAIEVLIVNVVASDNREIGVQIRNKGTQTLGNGINFQTSGFPLRGGFASPIIEQPSGSLLGNLIQLANNQSVGATLISVSNSFNSVWAIFKLLEAQVHLNVVSNPFLVTVNNYTAQVSLGETRRVKTGEVQSQLKTETQGDVTANLTVNITPLINSDGNINLQINISVDSFTDTNDPTSATRDTKTVKTNANVGNGQVLAVGGLLKTNVLDVTYKVPILGDIPLIGWLFKNKQKIKSKDNLLVFISPKIIEPKLEGGGIDPYSQDKADHAKALMCQMRPEAENRDIIHRWFFKDRPCEDAEYVDNYIAGRNEAAWCTTDCSGIPIDYDRINSGCAPDNEIINPGASNRVELQQKVYAKGHAQAPDAKASTLVKAGQPSPNPTAATPPNKAETLVKVEPKKTKRTSLMTLLPEESKHSKEVAA